MITITLVLEPALTVSPTPIPTEVMVPLIGLVSWASSSDCCAATRLAFAVSMDASSEAICSALSEEVELSAELPDAPELPTELEGLEVVAEDGVDDRVGELVEPLFPEVGVVAVSLVDDASAVSA